MNALIDRYLDGELSEEEARAFLDAVSADPALEAELRSYEAMLALAASHRAAGGPSDGLADRVMERVRGATRAAPAPPRSRVPLWVLWRPRVAWTAALAAIFTLGYFSAHVRPGPAVGPVATTVQAAASPRLVRLVYVPDDPGVRDVAVAGTFNAWGATPMQRNGNVFVAQMLLPPDVYEYMFVVNGEDWVTDPLAQVTSDDGFGRENAVLDLTL